MADAITIIVLIGTAVLFLSNVFRQVRNERERAQQRSARPPRPASLSTEQFLEEVNRRRQQASERGKPRPPVRPVTLTPAPKPPPRREPPTGKGPARAIPPRPARPSARPAAELLEVVPVDKPAASKPAPPSSPPSEPAPRPPVVQRIPLSPTLTQLLPLFRSRQTVRAAFVLHEILGPPRCRQKKVR
jgi:hypothetical protein